MKKILASLLLIFSSLSIVAQNFTDADSYILEGAKLHDKKQYPEALQKYQQALTINPNSISALYEMSLTYLQMGEYANAIKYSTQVLGFDFEPIKLDAYVIKGTALAKSGKTNDAIKMFLEAIEHLGPNNLLDYNLGYIYYKQGNNKKAIAYIRRSIEQDPTYPDAFLLYADILDELGIYIQSLYAYNFFLLQEPNTDRSHQAFSKMYKILTEKLTFSKINDADKSLGLSDLYKEIDKLRTDLYDKNIQYNFYAESSSLVFKTMNNVLKNDPSKYRGLFWDFFVPIYFELFTSGHFDAYLRYVSACYFPESKKWWEENQEDVMAFKLWFEDGVEQEMDEPYVEDSDDFVDSDIIEMDQQ